MQLNGFNTVVLIFGLQYPEMNIYSMLSRATTPNSTFMPRPYHEYYPRWLLYYSHHEQN